MKGLVVFRSVCMCEIFLINSLCMCVHVCVCFPLYTGMRPVSALSNPHSVPNPKPLICFAVSLPGRELLPSLSAGMNAHVEILARFQTRTKFSHTKAKGARGGKPGMKEPAARKIKGRGGSAR